MKRFVVIALMTAFAGTSVFAEESLSQVAARVVQSQLAAVDTTASARRTEAISSQAELWAVRRLPAPVVVPQQLNVMQQAGAPVLSTSGLKRRTKAMMFISMAAGFAATAWVIDHRVEDFTPSSLGTRQD